MPDQTRLMPPGPAGRWPLRLLVTLGVGLLPGPTGTYASVLVAGAAWLWLGAGGAPLAGGWFLLLVAAVSVLAVASSSAALQARLFGPGHDPGQIVIDEAAGQLIALYGVGTAGWEVVVALAAFRFFDILKPWPVGASQRLPGGWGVTVDDLLAGLYALAVVRLWVLWTG